jgi:hypothetical protein
MTEPMHPKLREKLAYADWAAKSFYPGDFFITLTFHPNVSQNLSLRSKDVRTYYRKIRSDLVKLGVIEKTRELYRFAVFEKNAAGDYHVHMMLENPFATLEATTKYIAALDDLWQSMKCAGLRAGMKIKTIDDSRDGTGYLTKDHFIRKELEVDVANLYLKAGQ